MAEPTLRQDALAHRQLLARARADEELARARAEEELARTRAEEGDEAGVTLWLEPPRTQLALRAEPADASAAVKRVTGAGLPAAAHGVSAGTRARLLWMGPDEWLVVAPGLDDALHGELEAALDDRHSLVSDVSHSRVAIGLAGARARDLLAKGCSLDLHPRVFPADRVAQSTIARAHALIHLLDDGVTFHLYVHRSFADYLYCWLRDAGGEYRLRHGVAG